MVPLKEQEAELLRKGKEVDEPKNSHLKNFLQGMLEKAASDKERAAIEKTTAGLPLTDRKIQEDS